MKITDLKVNGVKLYEFDEHKDARGILSVANFGSEIPFSPSRYFLVYGVPENKIRGEHAHKECHQFLVCTSGSVNVSVDDGQTKEEVVLDAANKGLYLPPKTWGVQSHYSSHACLMVLASHPYDKSDYITDYNEFKKFVLGK